MPTSRSLLEDPPMVVRAYATFSKHNPCLSVGSMNMQYDDASLTCLLLLLQKWHSFETDFLLKIVTQMLNMKMPTFHGLFERHGRLHTRLSHKANFSPFVSRITAIVS
ncbi:Hypothetical protein NTJ_04518 [Nesidiocoris tenuis]|uniref:Uncharacterized protein n=1 Tax=Nesidiocoris tenuis TaxID=355587 RepID=A0ABN7AKH9_9HEMI|nr:Hypothetical protein NTJ_04518 [Nesidiocoris tenuis]